MNNHLLFCDNCNGLTSEVVCHKCGKPTRKPQTGDMCFVQELSGISTNMFADALSNNDIKFVQVPNFSGANRYNTPSSYKFYVRYENYDEAVEVLSAIWGGNDETVDDPADVIDRIVKVIIDRPLGSIHPEHSDITYGLNYGYVDGVMGGDGEEQDAYVIGLDFSLNVGAEVDGYVIAVIRRKNDIETKWVVLPYLHCKKEHYTKEEIAKAVHFQEKYFDIEIIM